MLIDSLDVADLEEALEGLVLFKTWKSEPSPIDAYVTKARKKWPEASAFKKG